MSFSIDGAFKALLKTSAQTSSYVGLALPVATIAWEIGTQIYKLAILGNSSYKSLPGALDVDVYLLIAYTMLQLFPNIVVTIITTLGADAVDLGFLETNIGATVLVGYTALTTVSTIITYLVLQSLYSSVLFWSSTIFYSVYGVLGGVNLGISSLYMIFVLEANL